MRRAVPVVVASALLALALAGCSEAEQVASDAASAAGDQAKETALRELRDQVCPLVQDNDLSEQDRQTLASAVEVARGLGVESGLLDAAADVAGADGDPAESDVARVAEECRAP